MLKSFRNLICNHYKINYISVSCIFLHLKEMKFTEIQHILENLKIFSINDLRKIDPQFEKKKIFLWKKN